MIIVYVLVSLKTKYRYVGITADLKERIKRHNSGRNKATKPYMPFKLMHSEEYPDYLEARKREKFLKSGAGRKFLDNLQ